MTRWASELRCRDHLTALYDFVDFGTFDERRRAAGDEPYGEFLLTSTGFMVRLFPPERGR